MFTSLPEHLDGPTPAVGDFPGTATCSGAGAYEIFAPYWPKAPEEEQIIAEPQLENFDREIV